MLIYGAGKGIIPQKEKKVMQRYKTKTVTKAVKRQHSAKNGEKARKVKAAVKRKRKSSLQAIEVL